MEGKSIRDKAQRLMKTVEITNKLLKELQGSCPHYRIKHRMYPNPYNLKLQTHQVECDDCLKYIRCSGQESESIITKEWIEENGTT